MPETSEYNFAFVTTPGAESATGFVIGPSRRVRVTVEPLPGGKGIAVVSEEFPLMDEEKVAVAEKGDFFVWAFGYTPEMIESVDWDFRVRQPQPAPPPPSQLDDEMFEDYSDGWKHID